ncbi:type VI secretion system baseplate subunit TssG [Massilia oculi]|uniref:type VI secretion system baseplate subunit TssG n=1 Tax=Massilia oculi TaxID=945844 RepID=UPI001AAEA060|nr:type VI secretion system baseplate subunit TssG [Massilia oculi]
MRDPVALLGSLEEAPGSFDFYAALRLAECAWPGLPRIGQARRPQEEALRFGQQPSLAFEPHMLAALERAGPGDAEDGAAPRLLVNFFGLLGANGPMPVHLTEYVRERQRHHDDPTPARFLDLLQHRMIALLYRAWSSAQPALGFDRPGADPFAGYVAALVGLGMPSLRGRDAVPDLAKLHYAGRLGPHQRSAAGLAAILGDYLGAPVEVEQFAGSWMRLPAGDLARLRGGPAAERLGMGTVLGKRVWSAQHRFRLLVGPLGIERARALLPGTPGMRRLADWVRLYAGPALDWELNLIVTKDTLPGLRLGADSRLGWTTWVSSRAPRCDDRQLRLAPGRPSTKGDSHG